MIAFFAGLILGLVVGILITVEFTKSVIKDVKCKNCGEPISSLSEED